MRWFKIQDRVLYCYNNAEGRLRRAIPLEAAEVVAVENPRHEHYFEVTPGHAGAGATYMLKAETEEDMARWIKHIQVQSMAPTFHQRGEEHVLYPAEYGRYQFFKSQRDFINRLTDISEEMRFLDRPIRTKALKEQLRDSVKVPSAAYLPLCKSTDPWCRVLGVVPEEARAFSTKARCPCLVLVEVERDTVRALRACVRAYDLTADCPCSFAAIISSSLLTDPSLSCPIHTSRWTWPTTCTSATAPSTSK